MQYQNPEIIWFNFLYFEATNSAYNLALNFLFLPLELPCKLIYYYAFLDKTNDI